MSTVETVDFKGELLKRRDRLSRAPVGQASELARLLREIDEALDRIEEGTYGLCDVCLDPVEQDRLLGDPLLRTCLDHLTSVERQALEKDLALAVRVQRGMLPRDAMGEAGWTTAHHYEPAGTVGGDYCDLIPGPDGSLLFVVGDVSGKGVAASMLMASLRAIVRTVAGPRMSLVSTMESINRFFCESRPGSQFATLVLGYATPDGQVQICNAGHCPPLVLCDGAIREVRPSGFPVGMFCSATYQVETISVPPGSGFFIYTDGLSEARDGGDADFGAHRVVTLAAKHRELPPGAMVAAYLEELRAFRGAAAPTDDLTLLALRRDR
ncbi:MAG: SpoIIE family protein phosphatase [Acidobacteriota bacterium]